MDDLIKEFLVESYENLDQIDRDLVALEQNPGSQDLQSSIFRTLHTIKGSCGILGLVRLEVVTHAAENLLSKITLGEVPVSVDVVTALLATVDAVREILAALESTGEEGNNPFEHLLEQLAALQESGSTALPQQVAPLPLATVQSEEAVEGEESGSTGLDDTEAPIQRVAESNVRVDVRLLDSLMNLVGELVLARNQIIQYAGTQQDSSFQTTSQHLNLITTELQEGVMKTRMQPIGNVWRTIPRLVRDLSVARNRNVRVEMEGRDTELDRTIIEAIKDPLTHLIRNAIDHGLEEPEQRLKAGKPAEGCITLRAFHEGGQVTIEIRDDGRGIDLVAVKQKAIQKGLVTAEQVDRMTDRDAFGLIFLPGFSTASKVTNISGRGVGMDVVKTNVERIGGTVDVQSTPGAGTTFKLKIPLTLAIIPALIITSAGDRFAIPQASLLELVMLEGDDVMTGIEYVHDAPVYRLRGRILPLVYLNEVLRGSQGTSRRQACTHSEGDIVSIVVLQADNHSFGLVVDEINDTEEIVVKPLSKHLKGIKIFAGATIMGDGRVALILDLMGIVERCKVTDVSQTEQNGNELDPNESASTLQSMLLLEAGGQRYAVPMEKVARLEEFETNLVEQLGREQFIQYRGDILPLRHLVDFVGLNVDSTDTALSDAEKLQVVVCSENGEMAGLVVEHIVDVVEETVELRDRGHRSGICGTTVLQNRVTDLLDVNALLASVRETA